MTRATAIRTATTRLNLALALLQITAACDVAAGDLVFAPRDIAGWETKQFKRPVEYLVVPQDGREALRAVCTGRGASARGFPKAPRRESPVHPWPGDHDRLR